ncbi:hypothetical protein Patl1_14589 [Pistacia atlantica]|uniref:Uncharacterized protein n=1 Tax=Pistacia atlantica TaxID=434234 RepID=A0ACC1AXC4_9ROSI|nr:hypothetical protein Patl1_14589 [Pistacia atlantica]
MAVFLSGKLAVFLPHRVNLNPGLSSLDSLKFIGTLKMNGIVHSLPFANDSQQLLTSGSDGWIYRWDLRTITCIHGAVYEEKTNETAEELTTKLDSVKFNNNALILAICSTMNKNSFTSFYAVSNWPPPNRICNILDVWISDQLVVLLLSCTEIHVGPVGHPFKSCRGPNASLRKGLHEWTSAALEDVLLPVEAYHLFDRLQNRIRHDERFTIPRIPAVTELCIQAGVDIPEFPTKRRRKPIIRIAKREFVDADESELPDPGPPVPLKPILTEIPDSEIVAPSDKEEIVLLAEETLQAWEKMRTGALKLMKMYHVRVCGYCPEVHVGPSGHKAQNCGAFKHQQRNGQHGWQAAVLDDLIPPRYVWHVADVNGPPLQRELRSFYGQAPAVVEICVQAGAAVPDQYKSTMRLDIGIPSSVKEAEMVV